MRSPAAERGMALVTVLLLVAVMGALAAAALETMNRSSAMANNGRSAMQGQYLIRGAEAVTKARLRALIAATGDRLTRAGDWEGAPFAFPVEDGVLSVALHDGSHCFNLNSAVQGSDGFYSINPTGVMQFVALAQAVGIADADARDMAMALVDFIDTDNVPQAGGGEDGRYTAADPPYMTAGRLLADPDEVRAIPEFEAERYEALRPFLCALPTNEMSAINVNTLTMQDAPLVAMLAPRELSLERARQVIAARPPAGWSSRGAFWSEAALSGILPPARAVRQVAVNSRIFRAEIRADLGGFVTTSNALISVSGERAEVLQRRGGQG